MYCKKKRKEKKNKGQKKQIIFIFLLISCFRHFCFELLNLIFAALMLADEKMADKEGKYWRDYGHDFL